MNDIDRKILSKITQRTRFSISKIKSTKMEDLERELNIKARPPKIYFDWEKSEKDGHGYQNLKFVSEEEYARREAKLDSELKTRGSLNR
jgi:hypothetical protein